MKCTFCGRDLEDTNSVAAFNSQIDSDVFICEDCIRKMMGSMPHDTIDELVSPLIEEDAKTSEPQEEKRVTMLPHQIKDYLDGIVINQDTAKKILSVAICNHDKMLRYKNKKDATVDIEGTNILMIGSSGSGKTYLIKQIAKLLKRPCVIADASGLTKAGLTR